jgi:uncharacterized protein (TIGR02996 family)
MGATAYDFMADIIGNPEDDTLRLIYADWLEENDQQERAELIRVQCELSRYRAPDDGHTFLWAMRHWRGAPERIKLLCAREQDLLMVHYREWLPPGLWESLLGSGWPPNGQAAVFRRGFIGLLFLPLKVWCGGACVHCGGKGNFRVLRPLPSQSGTQPAGVGEINVSCVACCGTGRILALGPQLVRALPLEEVKLTDHRSPRWDSRTMEIRPFWWSREDVTTPIYRLLRGGAIRRGHPSRRCYPTQTNALDALSAALLTWARATTPSAAAVPSASHP